MTATSVGRHPFDTAKEIEALIPTMSDQWVKTKSMDLLAYWKRKGWSPAQAEFAEKLIARTKAPVAAAPAGAVVVTNDISGISALFDRPGSLIVYPKVRLAVQVAAGTHGSIEILPAADGTQRYAVPLTLSRAGARSRYPGSINVLYGWSGSEKEWFGAIATNGRFVRGRALASVFEPQLLALLTALAADPVGVATAHGKLTGHCCFCNLPLKDPKSTAVGYGKTCAEKWNMPY